LLIETGVKPDEWFEMTEGELFMATVVEMLVERRKAEEDASKGKKRSPNAVSG